MLEPLPIITHPTFPEPHETFTGVAGIATHDSYWQQALNEGPQQAQATLELLTRPAAAITDALGITHPSKPSHGNHVPFGGDKPVHVTMNTTKGAV